MMNGMIAMDCNGIDRCIRFHFLIVKFQLNFTIQKVVVDRGEYYVTYYNSTNLFEFPSLYKCSKMNI